MKVVYYASDKPREQQLAEAFGVSVRADGHGYEVRRTADYGDDRKFEGPTPDTDVACCFGVKGQSRQIISDHLALGRRTLYFDKGYQRTKGGPAGHTLYSKVVVNGSDATSYFQKWSRKPDRFETLGIRLEPRRPALPGGHVLFCGSSQKYGDFHGIGDVTRYAEKVVARLRKLTGRQIVYRPKPSWRDARPIMGAAYSTGSSTLLDALRGCHCLVTHGSNAAIEAVLAGVPVIVLGDGLAAPVAERDLENVEDPFWAKDGRRAQWAADMAWTQFTVGELRDGFAWSVLKEQLDATQPSLS